MNIPFEGMDAGPDPHTDALHEPPNAAFIQDNKRGKKVPLETT